MSPASAEKKCPEQMRSRLVPPTRSPCRPGTAARALLATLAPLLVLAALTGCATSSPEPLRVSREVLGTVVSVSAYGDDTRAIERASDDAYEAIAAAEGVLSAYPDEAADPTRPTGRRTYEVTSVVQFNRDPYQWHLLPSEAVTVLERIDALGVADYFSPSMLRVVGLYDFEGEQTVPDDDELARMTRAAQQFETRATTGGVEARFGATEILLAPPRPAYSSFAPPAVGLDLSGAAKGFALDGALRALERSGAVDGAIVSAGSTTVTFGEKPSAGGAGSKPDPWRIGIEDPRSPDKVIATVEANGPVTVSTSGDYQQAFVRNGVRYHHILNPATGRPAQGLRSLTVVGARDGLDSDILSTALFVMGPTRAEAYAREHGLGLFLVDAKGRTRIVPGPEGAAWKITASATN